MFRLVVPHSTSTFRFADYQWAECDKETSRTHKITLTLYNVNSKDPEKNQHSPTNRRKKRPIDKLPIDPLFKRYSFQLVERESKVLIQKAVVLLETIIAQFNPESIEIGYGRFLTDCDCVELVWDVDKEKDLKVQLKTCRRFYRKNLEEAKSKLPLTVNLNNSLK